MVQCGVLSQREADETTEPGMMPDLKLDDLVDMYGDPAVNEELRRRLSRSSKGDPKATLAHSPVRNQGDDFSRQGCFLFLSIVCHFVLSESVLVSLLLCFTSLSWNPSFSLYSFPVGLADSLILSVCAKFMILIMLTDFLLF